jgi:hypothetical protein
MHTALVLVLYSMLQGMIRYGIIQYDSTVHYRHIVDVIPRVLVALIPEITFTI